MTPSRDDQDLADLEAVIYAYDQTPRPQPPTHCDRAILALARGGKRRETFSSPWTWTSALAAGVALGVGLVAIHAPVPEAPSVVPVDYRRPPPPLAPGVATPGVATPSGDIRRGAAAIEAPDTPEAWLGELARSGATAAEVARQLADFRRRFPHFPEAELQARLEALKLSGERAR